MSMKILIKNFFDFKFEYNETFSFTFTPLTMSHRDSAHFTVSLEKIKMKILKMMMMTKKLFLFFSDFPMEKFAWEKKGTKSSLEENFDEFFGEIWVLSGIILIKFFFYSKVSLRTLKWHFSWISFSADEWRDGIVCVLFVDENFAIHTCQSLDVMRMSMFHMYKINKCVVWLEFQFQMTNLSSFILCRKIFNFHYCLSLMRKVTRIFFFQLTPPFCYSFYSALNMQVKFIFLLINKNKFFNLFSLVARAYVWKYKNFNYFLTLNWFLFIVCLWI